MIPTKVRVIRTGEVYGIQEILPINRTLMAIQDTIPITYMLLDFNEVEFIYDEDSLL